MKKTIAIMHTAASKLLIAGGCLSCRAEHLNGLAVSAAKIAGAKADFALEASEARKTATLRGSLEQALFQVQDPPPGTDGMLFSLMQISAAGVPPRLATDYLVHHVVALQLKEGDWPHYGVAR